MPIVALMIMMLVTMPLMAMIFDGCVDDHTGDAQDDGWSVSFKMSRRFTARNLRFTCGECM